LLNVALLKGAQATTAIEGNTLSEEEIKKMMEVKNCHQAKPIRKLKLTISLKH